MSEAEVWLERAVRAGLVTYGVVHLIVGVLALQLALGEKSESASNNGALHALAEQPFGTFLVWAVAIGMFLLVGWRIFEAIQGDDDEDGASDARYRVVQLAKAGIYGVLGWSAARVAVGDGSNGGTDSTTDKLMDLPAGKWIVVLAGLAVIAYALNLIHRGWTEKFTEHLEIEGQTGKDGRAYVLFGKVGHIAKGAAIALVGGLLVWAGWTHDARKSGSLDVALQMVRDQPFGSVLLAAIALGIGCYGLFCFARARHLDR